MQPSAPERFKVQFTASQEYVDLLQEARDLASHALPSGSLEQLHLQAMRLLVAQLKKRRCATPAQPRMATPTPYPRESRQHADEPGTPRQRDTGAPRQRDTGAPRQRGTDAPRQHATGRAPRASAAVTWRLLASTGARRALRDSAGPMLRASAGVTRALRASASAPTSRGLRASKGATRGLRASAPTSRALRDSAEPMRPASAGVTRRLRDGTGARRALRDSADTCLAACNAWSGLVMGHAAATSTAEASDVAKPRFSSCTISSRTAAAARPRRTTSRCAATLTMRSPPSRTSVGASCKPSGVKRPEQGDEAALAPAAPRKPQGEGKDSAPLQGQPQPEDPASTPRQRRGGGRTFVKTKRSEAAGPGRRGRAGASGAEKASG